MVVLQSLEASLAALLAQLEALPKDLSSHAEPSTSATAGLQSHSLPADTDALTGSSAPSAPSAPAPRPLAALGSTVEYLDGAVSEESDDYDDEEDEEEAEEDTESEEEEPEAWDPSQATPIVERRRPRRTGGSDRGEDPSVLAAVNAERAALGEPAVVGLTVAVLRVHLAGKRVGGAEWRGGGKKKADLVEDYRAYLAEGQTAAEAAVAVSPSAAAPDAKSPTSSGKKRFSQLRTFLSPGKRKDSTGSSSSPSGALLGLFRKNTASPTAIEGALPPVRPASADAVVYEIGPPPPTSQGRRSVEKMNVERRSSDSARFAALVKSASTGNEYGLGGALSPGGGSGAAAVIHSVVGNGSGNVRQSYFVPPLASHELRQFDEDQGAMAGLGGTRGGSGPVIYGDRETGGEADGVKLPAGAAPRQIRPTTTSLPGGRQTKESVASAAAAAAKAKPRAVSRAWLPG